MENETTAHAAMNAGDTTPAAEIVAIENAVKPAKKPVAGNGPEAKETVGEQLHELAEMRHDPEAIRHAFETGEYPYKTRMRRTAYEEHKAELQVELLKVQDWVKSTGQKVVIIFEGRDGAGKGGTIKAVTQYMNPRYAHVVALPKPTDRERGEWYFQRYARHLPSTGEMRLFDRSWYNRAVVEPVMGFCSRPEYEAFLAAAPEFEHMLVKDGIHFFKFWLNIGQETQLKRFHDRRHEPLKVWKLSPVDMEALTKWDDYTVHRDRMLDVTHTRHAPWTVVKANDKRRARLNVIRHVLSNLDYTGKSKKAIGEIDDRILMPADEYLKQL